MEHISNYFSTMLILPDDFEDLIDVNADGVDCGGRAQKQGRIITGKLIISGIIEKIDELLQLGISLETMILNIYNTTHTYTLNQDSWLAVP